MGDRIKNKQNKMSKYKVLTPINKICLKEIEFKLGDFFLKYLSTKEVNAIIENNNFFSDKNLLSEFKSNPVGCVFQESTDSKGAIKEGRKRITYFLSIIRLILSENIDINDQNLLWQLSEYTVIQKLENSKYGYQWESDRNPIKITLNKKDYNEQKINFYTDLTKVKRKIRNRINRAIYWVNLSILEEYFDVKIVHLCTALESLLTTINDRRKGENIAFRAFILDSYFNSSSILAPEDTLKIYRQRSKIIHGSKTEISSSKEYNRILYLTRNTIYNIVKLNLENDFQNTNEMLKFIDYLPNRHIIVYYLLRFPSKSNYQILSIKFFKFKILLDITHFYFKKIKFRNLFKNKVNF